MLIATGCDPTDIYAEMIATTCKNALKYQYDFFALALNKQKIVNEFYRMKPALLLTTLEEMNTTTAWLDGDAVLLRPIELTRRRFDIAFTLKDPKDLHRKPDIVHYIQDAVVIANPTRAAKKFLKKWAGIVDGGEVQRSSQFYLNRMLQTELKKANPGLIKKIEGTNILFLDCTEYNNYRASENMELPDKAKIVQFKGDKGRANYFKYKEKFNL